MVADIRNKFMIVFLALTESCVLALAQMPSGENGYSGVPAKSPAQQVKPEVILPNQTGDQEAASLTPINISDRLSKISQNTMKPYVGIGGYYPSGLNDLSGNFGFLTGLEYRFYEPLFVSPEIGFGRTSTYLGLRSRGGLPPSKDVSGDAHADTSITEFRFALLAGLELTPQDGIFHVTTGIGPSLRTFAARETSTSLEERPPLTNSELNGKAWGLLTAVNARVDIARGWGFFGGVRWNIVFDKSSSSELTRSPILSNGMTPGFATSDTKLIEKNSLAWAAGAQYSF